jgi:hypothetical protein
VTAAEAVTRTTVPVIIQEVFVANREATMTLEGTVINGQIVLDQPQVLPEGAKVRVQLQKPPPPTITHEEWVRQLRALAMDCGVGLSNEALSSEGLYD